MQSAYQKLPRQRTGDSWYSQALFEVSDVLLREQISVCPGENTGHSIPPQLAQVRIPD